MKIVFIILFSLSIFLCKAQLIFPDTLGYNDTIGGKYSRPLLGVHYYSIISQDTISLSLKKLKGYIHRVYFFKDGHLTLKGGSQQCGGATNYTYGKYSLTGTDFVLTLEEPAFMAVMNGTYRIIEGKLLDQFVICRYK